MSINEITMELKNNENMNKRELYEKMTELHPIKKIEFAMYNLFGYIYNETREKEIRHDQNSFRNDLIKRYTNCLITSSPELLCEACHIIPHSECEDKYKYDVDNGLLFRADLHKLFDSKKFKINPNTFEIEFSDNILNNKSYNEYHKYNKKILNINKNSAYFLREIYKK
jgi:hypothetical protein